ncbi:MAG: hypothetical protein FWF01_02170 [Alphaproteobacteria bacterium]|nr:hypothetical protein [Alphaproteobacteria bacterium]
MDISSFCKGKTIKVYRKRAAVDNGEETTPLPQMAARLAARSVTIAGQAQPQAVKR